MNKILLLLIVFTVLTGCSAGKNEGIPKGKAEKIVLENIKQDEQMEKLNADSNEIISEENLEVLRVYEDKKWKVWMVQITTSKGEEAGHVIAEYKVDMAGEITGWSIY